jgi:protein SCO1/2
VIPRSIIAAAAIAALMGWTPAARAQNDAGAPLPGTSLYNLDETWVNQDGKRAPLSSLRGKIVVAAMGYTTCKDMCPAVVADMMWIDKHLPPEAAKKVSFVFFTFDSVADSPERLQLYAEGHGLDLNRWTLFGSNDDTARELAAALGVAWRPDGAGGFDHTAVISLLDADGVIVFQQLGTQATSAELLANLKALVAATR